MSFFAAIKTCFSKYVTFSGRAERSEFWYWVLFTIVCGLILNTLDSALFPEQVSEFVYPLSSAFNILVALPGLAVGCRRLHDVGRSGWWQLLLFTIIGIPFVIFWWARKGNNSIKYSI